MRLDRNRNALIAAVFASLAALMMCAAMKAQAAAGLAFTLGGHN